MNRDELYNILYKDGKCNHDTFILDILKCIIHSDTSSSMNIHSIDRWNIYNDSGSNILHIVYTLVVQRKYNALGVRPEQTSPSYLESYQVKVPIEEFTNRYREYQLNKLLC